MNPLAIAKSMINKDFTREWRCITQFQIVKERSLSGAMLPGAIASEQQSVCYESSLAGGVKVLLSCWTGDPRGFSGERLPGQPASCGCWGLGS